MIRVEVNGGACNFNSEVKVTSDDMQTASIEFKTECPNLKPLEQELREVDAYEECFAKLGEASIFEVCKKYCKNAACPVPTAIIKGIEAECGLALPKSIQIKISRE